jgi:hypothetical protein
MFGHDALLAASKVGFAESLPSISFLSASHFLRFLLAHSLLTNYDGEG